MANTNLVFGKKDRRQPKPDWIELAPADEVLYRAYCKSCWNRGKRPARPTLEVLTRLREGQRIRASARKQIEAKQDRLALIRLLAPDL